MSDGVLIALIGFGGVVVTAVIAPPLVAVVNHLITARNETRKTGLKVAEAQDKRIKALEREVRRLSRSQSGERVYRPRVRRRDP